MTIILPEDEFTCPDCGRQLQPLTGNWTGYYGCFCAFGGKEPTAAAIVAAVETEELMMRLAK